MTGSTPSSWPASVRFYLDESLPPSVAEALRLVGYPITDPVREQKRGAKDPQLIPWMAEQGLVWITRDHDAKRAHRADIRSNRLSVVWVRGISRGKGNTSPHDVHSMLTAKLLHIAHEIASANGPMHYEVYAHGDPRSLRVAAKPVDFERIRESGSLRRARR